MEHRQEYTPVQISFDLGSAIHREALFQVLLTLEHAEEEDAAAAAQTAPGVPVACSCCEETEDTYEDENLSYGDVGDDPNG